MSTVFMMSARMCTIATTCIVLLCVLLFVIGLQVGQRLDARAPVGHARVASAQQSSAPAAGMAPAAAADAETRAK